MTTMPDPGQQDQSPDRRQLLRRLGAGALTVGVVTTMVTPPRVAMATGATGVIHVDPAGSDSNDGSEPGLAKQTIAAALAALPSTGGEVALSAGTFPFASDLVLPTTGPVTIRGCGPKVSHLSGTGASLVAEQAEKFTWRDFSISRSGTAGPAIAIRPGANNGSRRFLLDNVHVTASSGIGIAISESWVATLVNVIIQQCQVGISVTVGPLFSSSANAITMIGGEIQGNGLGAEIAGVLGWRMIGTAVEGNALGGLRFTGTSRSVHINGYFEGNAGFDLWYDANPSGGYGFTVESSTFLHTAASGARAIVVRRCHQVRITESVFSAYPDPPILVNETAAAVTSGWAENCRVVGASTDLVEVSAGTQFGKRTDATMAAEIVAPSAVRTELGRMLLDLPAASATTISVTMSAITTGTAGSAYLGTIVTTAAGAVVASRASAVPATGGVTRATWSIDVGAFRGQSLLIGFRRVGENSADTYTGTFTFVQGSVDVWEAVTR